MRKLAPALATAWVLLLGAAAVAAPRPQARPPADFHALASQLTSARESGAEESQADEEQALAILDRAVLEQLNSPRPEPDLDALNMRLASFVTRTPPVGEGYRVVRLGNGSAAYALLADFGLSGPSAVRVYAGPPGGLALAARVDRHTQENFFDDYMEIAPLPGPAPVFVTVTGRTDDLKTGEFTAWYFGNGRVERVWTSDILLQSSYEVAPDGFRLTYCAETDPDDPATCRAMQRDRYLWQDLSWKRVETTALPVTPARP